MAFFDTFKELPSGDYVGEKEKDVLMENGIPFTITALALDEANKYGPRYVASITVPDPATGEDEEKLMSFPIGNVESRNRMLAEMKTYLEGDEAEPVKVKLELIGRSKILRPA